MSLAEPDDDTHRLVVALKRTNLAHERWRHSVNWARELEKDGRAGTVKALRVAQRRANSQRTLYDDEREKLRKCLGSVS